MGRDRSQPKESGSDAGTADGGKGAETSDGSSRSERKQQTREHLIDAALELLRTQSFEAMSLREVTKKAGVAPAAFYRHFPDMTDLGLTLVDESIGSLRQMLRAVRVESVRSEDLVDSSLRVLFEHVKARPDHFRFVVRERQAGMAALRRSIVTEIRLIATELATDLARVDALRRWNTDEILRLADLVVQTSVSAVEALVDNLDDERAAAEIFDRFSWQLHLILGATPSKGPSSVPSAARTTESHTVAPRPKTRPRRSPSRPAQ
jgi:AcrR family transcriptional regulator